MLIWAALVAIALSFSISYLSSLLAAPVAYRLGFLDVPGRHKAHGRPVPLLGGSAIFIAVLAPSLLALALASVWAADGVPQWLTRIAPEISQHVQGAAAKAPQALGILLAALAMHVLGLVDDRKHLGPWSKLAVQVVIIGLVVFLLDVRVLTRIGYYPSCLLTILWLTTITNAFNFLDNMDGLAAGVAAICAAALLAAAASITQIFVSAWLCLLLGAVLGFLPHNFAPAKIYMGDAGSLLLGFLLGVISCLTTYVHDLLASYSVLAPLVVMAIPLYDTVSVIVLRIRERQHPMVGDRRHFSHRLVRRGMSVRKAVITIYLCTAGTAIAATLLPRVDATGAVLIIFQTLAILMVVAMLESGDAKA